MGLLLSRILGSKTTLRDRLEKVDKELRNLQRFQFDTELSQKRWIGRFMIVSTLIYLIAGILCYIFLPKGLSWNTTIIYLIPFFIFPFIIWGVRRSLFWYYKQKIGNNAERHKELKEERKRLLEDVMEYESFNTAKEILEKYDPNRLLPKYLEERLNTANSLSSSPVSSSLQTPTSSSVLTNDLRRRNVESNISGLIRATATPLIRPIQGTQGQFFRQTTNMPITRPNLAIMPTPSRNSMPPPLQTPSKGQFRTQPHNIGQRFGLRQPPPPVFMTPQPPGNPTLHNRNTGWIDKLVDYIVGDGPNHRYALICKYCATHNGLATEEDFPYTGYRCVFCHQYNPPKKVKPAAEKLPVNSVLIEEIENDKNSDVGSPATSDDHDDKESSFLQENTESSSLQENTESSPKENIESSKENEASSTHSSEDLNTPELSRTDEDSTVVNGAEVKHERDANDSIIRESTGENLSVEENEPFVILEKDSDSATTQMKSTE